MLDFKDSCSSVFAFLRRAHEIGFVIVSLAVMVYIQDVFVEREITLFGLTNDLFICG